MKRLLPILFCLCACLMARAQVTITNHTLVGIYSDSFGAGTFGNRQNFFLLSFYAQMYPQFVISPRDRSTSGRDNFDMATNRMQKFGDQDASLCTGVTNLLNFLYVSGNHATGDPVADSNTIRNDFLKIVQFPDSTYNRLGIFTNDPPIANSALHVRQVVIGDIPYWPFPSGVPNTLARDYSYGGRTVALANSLTFVDTYALLSNAVVVAYNLNTNGFWFSSGTGNVTNDHPENELQFVWHLVTLHALGEETNIFTAVLDWNNPGTPSQTNHCAVVNGSIASGTFSFTFKADRMGSSYYAPSASQTNNSLGGFPLLPGSTNYECEIIRVTNAPAGLYAFYEDGVYLTNFSSTKLATGINLFSDVQAGAMWNQKQQTLALLCDYANVSRTNASDTFQRYGTNALWFAQGSYASAVWPTNSISVSSYIAQNDMQHRNADLLTQDQVFNANVQQTNHTFALVSLNGINATTLNVYAVNPFVSMGLTFAAILAPKQYSLVWDYAGKPEDDTGRTVAFSVEASADLVNWQVLGTTTNHQFGYDREALWAFHRVGSFYQP